MSTAAAHTPMQDLLDLVEADRVARLAAIRAQGIETAAALLREARRGARARVNEALAHERRRLQARLDALEARAATEQRLARQRCLRERLEIAWEALPRALEARWRSPESRMQWARGALEVAAGVLGAQAWRVVHASGWPAEEREAVTAELAERGIGAPRFEEDGTLRGGLVVHAGANALDATVRGLLADRAALGARLAAVLSPAEESA